MNVLLDGLTIKGGNADGTAGGAIGLYAYFSSMSSTIEGSEFLNNNAPEGRALGVDHCWYDPRSYLTVVNSTFIGNGAEDFSAAKGGALYLYSWEELAGLEVAISNSVFAGNAEIWVAAWDDGGVPGVYAPISLRDDTKMIGGFDGDETSASQSDPGTNKTYVGGRFDNVVSFANDSTAVLRGFWITDSSDISDERPRGMYIDLQSRPIIVDWVFHDMDASQAVGSETLLGGPVVIYGQSSPTFVNCEFYGNDDAERGGAVYSENSTPHFHNCLFYENTAEDGGAFYNRGGAPTFINCTFADNDADNDGGAIYDENERATFRNCILWGNADAVGSCDQIHPCAVKNVDVEYSDVKAGWTGTGNIDSNPFFVSAANDNYRLRYSGRYLSACVDAGNDDDVPADVADLDWNGTTTEDLPKDLNAAPLALDDRISYCDGVDMGAYEYQAMCLIE